MIQVRELTKAYGQTLAVDHISFEVPRGQIVGFLGPNGAGKSTTLKMLTCYLPPTSGGATVNGFDIFHQSEQVRAEVELCGPAADRRTAGPVRSRRPARG